MLWEVERILKEVDELPQILLMENVPAVCGSANIADFAKWCTFLESIGYTNKYKILNATEYGVPQNRERCFMVSWLGDYYYDFPMPVPLTKRLKDVLEPVVDERYYLSDETIKSLQLHKERNEQKGNGFGWRPTDGGGALTASRQKEATVQTATSSSVNEVGFLERGTGQHQSNTVYGADGISPTITADGGKKEPYKILCK